MTVQEYKVKYTQRERQKEVSLHVAGVSLDLISVPFSVTRTLYEIGTNNSPQELNCFRI